MSMSRERCEYIVRKFIFKHLIRVTEKQEDNAIGDPTMGAFLTPKNCLVCDEVLMNAVWQEALQRLRNEMDEYLSSQKEETPLQRLARELGLSDKCDDDLRDIIETALDDDETTRGLFIILTTALIEANKTTKV